jgi:hypothetical protein
MTTTTSFQLNLEDFQDICDTAGYSISYWANKATCSKNVYFVWPDDEQRTFATRHDFQSAIVKIYGGSVEVNDSILNSIKWAVDENEYGEIDGHAADVIVQIAIYGKIIYG